MPPTYYRGCWHVVSRGFLVEYRHTGSSYSTCRSSSTTEFYEPKPFFTHAALLRQTCVHCGRFPTAASRRSLGRVSVPVWPITLSGRLRIVALVGRYPTNQLMRRRPIHQRQPKPSFNSPPRGGKDYPVLATVSRSYPRLMGRLPTCYSPVRHSIRGSKLPLLAFDLHVLGTPPAFILSQDQTLHNWKAHLELLPCRLRHRTAFILSASICDTLCVSLSRN